MRRRRSTPIQSLARFINRLRFPSLRDYTNEEIYGEGARRWGLSTTKDFAKIIGSLTEYDSDDLAAELEARGWRVVGP